MPSYGAYGERVLRETADGCFVFDVPSGRHARLAGSRTDPWPAPTEAEMASAMHGDTIVLANRDGVTAYSVAGAF